MLWLFSNFWASYLRRCISDLLAKQKDLFLLCPWPEVKLLQEHVANFRNWSKHGVGQ
jgi:hypothetical protein